MFGLSELAVVLIVVIAVLAAKKLPELARSAGRSARILKAEARAVREQDDAGEAGTAPRIIQGEVQRPSAPGSERTGDTPPSDGPTR